jgi:hypothetical protein
VSSANRSIACSTMEGQDRMIWREGAPAMRGYQRIVDQRA